MKDENSTSEPQFYDVMGYTHWLVGWLVNRVVGWLVGQLVGWLIYNLRNQQT